MMTGQIQNTSSQGLTPADIFSGQLYRMLRCRNNIMGAWLLFHCWFIIVTSVMFYVLIPNIFTLILSIVLIGGRQLGLAILMHEGSHSLLFRSKWANENLTRWFAAWPMIISLKEYRKRHMKHHRFTRTEKDPENYLYTPFPVQKWSMARKILRDLTGLTFIRTNLGLARYIAGPSTDGVRERFKRLVTFYKGPFLANGILLLLAVLFDRIDVFLLLWLLPMATSYMFFLRIRNISEHATISDLDDPLKNSRTTRANWLERLTFAPYWVNFHIEHHLLPDVPCYRLPFVHKHLLEKGFGPHMELQKGYASIIQLNSSAL